MKITRRDALQFGTGAVASLALPWRTTLAQPGELIKRAIPSTGHEVPIIGIGTARRYNVGAEVEDRQPLREVLDNFTRLGGGVLDTAPTYGTAEQVCGDIVRGLGNRDRLFIANKIFQSLVEIHLLLSNFFFCTLQYFFRQTIYKVFLFWVG